MRADFDQEKKRAVNVATRSLERDLERLKADHATELEELIDKHKQEISETKKKQWVSFLAENVAFDQFITRVVMNDVTSLPARVYKIVMTWRRGEFKKD